MHKLKSLVKRVKPVWIFPIIITVCLGAATVGKLSGSSFGPYYDTFLTGSATPRLIAGSTQPIRSDEWLVVTQFTIAQEKAGYPLINHNLGSGKNMSLVTDAPYKEWSVIFKPQNLAFFAMPFENAFAFKWWFLLAALLLAIYFLTLRFLPDKYLTASLISIIGGFAPFIFWWYQSITVLSVAWGCFALVLAMRIVEMRSLSIFSAKKRSLLFTQILLSSLLTYTITAFLLLLYPAFQIPVLIVIGLIFTGWFLNAVFSTRKKSQARRALYKSLFTLAGSAIAAILIVTIFLLTRLDAVKALTQTSYPGSRVVASGNYSSVDLLRQAGFNQYRLQDLAAVSSLGKKYEHNPKASSINQSELSSYIVIPFILLPQIIFFIWARWRSKRKVDWLGSAIILCNIIFMAHIFIPNFSVTVIFKPLGLYLIPIPRLQIGVGLLGIMSLIYVIKRMRILPLKFTPYLYIYSGAIVLFYIVAAIIFSVKTSGFSGDIRVALIAAITLAAGLVLVATKYRYNTGLSLIVALSIGSVVFVQPLYSGLGVGYRDNTIVNKIAAISDKTSVWAVADTVVLENYPWLANRKTISGVHPYPDLAFWSQVSSNKKTYNRYAHVLVSDSVQEELALMQPDVFIAKLSCTNHIGKTVTHVLTAHRMNLPCYQLTGETTVGSGTYFFYKKAKQA